MGKKITHKDVKRTRAETERFKAVRERFRARPTLQQLLATGDYEPPVPLGQYLERSSSTR